MKHELARIRVEAALLYAQEHPEVRLLDIGMALGYAPSTAKTTLGTALKLVGLPRRRGGGSLAYPKKRQRKYDHDLILALIRQGTSYAQVAKQVGCSPRFVSNIATKNGIVIGRQTEEFNRRLANGKKIRTDEELRTYFAEPVPGPLHAHAVALGYTVKGLEKAIKRLGIKRVKRQLV